MKSLHKIKKKIYNLRWDYKRKLHLLFRSAKFFYQRRTRGFDDSETWSFDSTAAEWILPRLKRLRELGLTTDESWYTDIDEMIFAFEYACGDDKFGALEDDEDYIRAQKGLEIFARRFFHLWW